MLIKEIQPELIASLLLGKDYNNLRDCYQAQSLKAGD
jgi:hypothetical protein